MPAVNSPRPLLVQQGSYRFRNSLLRDFPEREYRRHHPHRLPLALASSSDSRNPPIRACAPLLVVSSHHCRVCFLIFPLRSRLHHHLCYQQPHQSNIPNYQFHMSGMCLSLRAAAYLFLLAKQIAGYLIILRLAQGRAWSTDTLAHTRVTPQLTTVQFSSRMESELEAEPQMKEVESQLRASNSSLPTDQQRSRTTASSQPG